MRVPVHIVAGFLGAGKTTTLLKALSKRPHERSAVIVNDFGDARFDATRLEIEAGVAVEDIPGSCVCCTAPEGFAASLERILDEVKPDRIYVEPTGLARPADLVDTLRRGPWKDRIELGPVVVVVRPNQDSPTIREQAEAADLLVANGVDLVSELELSDFHDWVSKLWPGPSRVIETTQGELPDDALEWAEGEGPRRRFSAVNGHEVHHAARSWIWPSTVVFSKERLADALAKLVTGRAGAELARLKGLVRTEEGCFRVEVAGGEVSERPSAYRRDSRVDVIVEGLDEAPLERAALWFEEAVLTEEERRVVSDQIEVVRADGTRACVDRDMLNGLPEPVEDVSSFVPGREGRAARLSQLFDALNVPLDGEVVVVASDGYATPAVPAAALHSALILHSLSEDEALPTGKGGPFRLLIPGDAGPAGACSNVKGVVRFVLR